MPQLIPFTNDGCRTIDIALGDNMLKLRTYYLPYTKHWVLDIMDQEENPIAMGLSLNVGVDNIVRGKSILFQNQTIRVISLDGTENNTPNSLGESCVVLYYPEGETPPQLWPDKMLEV